MDALELSPLRTSLTTTFKTKELCSFCKERPFDLVCQCGDKFDFNCIAHHVEALNFEYTDEHAAVGDELAKLDAMEDDSKHDASHEVIDNWVSIEFSSIQRKAK